MSSRWTDGALISREGKIPTVYGGLGSSECYCPRRTSGLRKSIWPLICSGSCADFSRSR